ncbi:hypothetical protein Dip518_000408 [Parelusimicrobium proximum]|uniref:hypothetical protein n=1 Tax=Parelusimicrobium proximum TaxID=3228953 RepID=UPI003D16FE16
MRLKIFLMMSVLFCATAAFSQVPVGVVVRAGSKIILKPQALNVLRTLPVSAEYKNIGQALYDNNELVIENGVIKDNVTGEKIGRISAENMKRLERQIADYEKSLKSNNTSVLREIARTNPEMLAKVNLSRNPKISEKWDMAYRTDPAKLSDEDFVNVLESLKKNNLQESLEAYKSAIDNIPFKSNKMGEWEYQTLNSLSENFLGIREFTEGMIKSGALWDDDNVRTAVILINGLAEDAAEMRFRSYSNRDAASYFYNWLREYDLARIDKGNRFDMLQGGVILNEYKNIAMEVAKIKELSQLITEANGNIIFPSTGASGKGYMTEITSEEYEKYRVAELDKVRALEKKKETLRKMLLDNIL